MNAPPYPEDLDIFFTSTFEWGSRGDKRKGECLLLKSEALKLISCFAMHKQDTFFSEQEHF